MFTQFLKSEKIGDECKSVKKMCARILKYLIDSNTVKRARAQGAHPITFLNRVKKMYMICLKS